MSKRILRALMQLFSFIAIPDVDIDERRKIIEGFLTELLNREQVQEYLSIYCNFVKQNRLRKNRSNPKKILALSSVKVLSICTLLNQELTSRQKLIIIIYLVEFVRNRTTISEQELEFVETVAEIFKIPEEEFKNIKTFIFKKGEEFTNSDNFLVVNGKKFFETGISHFYVKGLKGSIYFLYIRSQNILVFYFEDEKEVYLNQQLLKPKKLYLLTIGSALRIQHNQPIYYSDIIAVFNEKKIKHKIIFEADKISYKFKNGNYGVHEFSFVEQTGKLVGIMGASGSGKTTLLNVLNGMYKPTTGHIFINGIDLHLHQKKLNGFIGYVRQDDLLIEELTVFENLYFSAKLSFGNLSDFEIKRKVLQKLKELGLYEIKDHRVGSVLNQYISGGQRKRLNIALELIREPPILFLDEPTSGLSSRDSENIMDLLKNLAIKGKLIFTVIHQPSSTIFKMFDRLMVIDQEGYLIFDGKPIEAILYFKKAVMDADWTDTVCPVCGNVNPEQIFNIIETKVLDEFGNPTMTRRYSPEEWYERFRKYKENKVKKKSFLVRDLPKLDFDIPNKIKQFIVFTKRDLLTKINNKAYLIINIIETPLMAFILSYLIKFWDIDSNGYKLYHNENLPVYIFMSVIIAVFVGLILSAQEIYKDRKILKRETFLNLSRTSYLMSKLFNLFFISAYQSFAYVLVGALIMKISYFIFEYWLILFGIWFASNILGLIISETFKSSSAIYIVIPFLVIPQIILSGVLVPYNKFNPILSKPYSVPWYGELMIARWGYEALSVKQFKDNKYYKKIYEYEKLINQADYIKNFWCPTMQNKLNDYLKYRNDLDNVARCQNDLQIVKNELEAGHFWTEIIKMPFDTQNINLRDADEKLVNKIRSYLNMIKDYYIRLSNQVFTQKDDFIKKYDKTHTIKLYDLKLNYHNEKLESFVTNNNLKQKIIIYNDRLYRMADPVFFESEHKFFKAQFYAPYKPFLGYQIDTFWFNLAVVWLNSVFLYIVLYYRLIPKTAAWIEEIRRYAIGEETVKKKRKKNFK